MSDSGSKEKRIFAAIQPKPTPAASSLERSDGQLG
jgi:hypothetical protein